MVQRVWVEHWQGIETIISILTLKRRAETQITERREAVQILTVKNKVKPSEIYLGRSAPLVSPVVVSVEVHHTTAIQS